MLYIDFLTSRGQSDVKDKPFREWYSKVIELRSLLASDTKFMMLTATATTLMQSKIFSMLDLEQDEVFCKVLHPNKNNIK